jgi:hypothetical protein
MQGKIKLRQSPAFFFTKYKRSASKKGEKVGTAIDFKKQMTETVFINIPGPAEPTPGMSGGELLHGFLAELYKTPTSEQKTWLSELCLKWNVHFKEER